MCLGPSRTLQLLVVTYVKGKGKLILFTPVVLRLVVHGDASNFLIED